MNPKLFNDIAERLEELDLKDNLPNRVKVTQFVNQGYFLIVRETTTGVSVTAVKPVKRPKTPKFGKNAAKAGS